MQSNVTTKGQITLPADLRKRFGIERGQKVMFEATADGILVKPVKVIDLTKRPAWKRALEASIAEADAGKTKVFKSSEEFVAHLEAESRKTRGRGK